MRYRPHCVPLLSGVTFSWMTGLLSLGHKKLLHMEDLGELPQVDGEGMGVYGISQNVEGCFSSYDGVL